MFIFHDDSYLLGDSLEREVLQLCLDVSELRWVGSLVHWDGTRCDS